MADKKPERLGKLEKPRRFAPKRPVKKEPKSTQGPGNAGAQADAGSSGAMAATEDDPFAALMQQAEAAKTTARKPVSRSSRASKFQVAFGATGQQSMESSDLLIKPKVKAGGASGPGGPSKGSGTKSTSKIGVKNEDGEIVFPDDEMKEYAKKIRQPLFDRDTYYPSVIPFTHVDTPHDPNVAMDAGLPIDLSTQEPEEADAAEELGLNTGNPDGIVALLQLPPLLPSVSLFEAAERAALETPASECQPLPEGTKPKPKFHTGPDVLKTLPSGKIGTMQVMKSGKVYLKIGCARYLVRPGVEHEHRTELHLVNLKTNDIVMVATDFPTASASLDLSPLLAPEP